MTTKVSVRVLGTPITIYQNDGSLNKKEDERGMKPGDVFKHDSLGKMRCMAVVNKEDSETKEIYCSILQNYYYDKDGKGFYCHDNGRQEEREVN